MLSFSKCWVFSQICRLRCHQRGDYFAPADALSSLFWGALVILLCPAGGAWQVAHHFVNSFSWSCSKRQERQTQISFLPKEAWMRLPTSSVTTKKQVSQRWSCTCYFSWRYCITSCKTKQLYLQLPAVCGAPALTLCCHLSSVRRMFTDKKVWELLFYKCQGRLNVLVSISQIWKVLLSLKHDQNMTFLVKFIFWNSKLESIQVSEVICWRGGFIHRNFGLRWRIAINQLIT